MKESRNSFEILTGEPKGIRLIKSPRRKWKESIRTYLKELSISMGSCSHSAWDRIIGKFL